MRTAIGVTMLLFFTSAGAVAQTIAGDWSGTLNAGGVQLRLVLHVSAGDGGSFKATLDSPDQGAIGIPVSTISLNGSSVSFQINAIRGSYEGTLNADATVIEGKWSQGAGTLPLVLSRVKDSSTLVLKRPQNPAKPYPYREEDVTYLNSSANITLAATLTTPRGDGPFPAVLLITGSGPQDRDESLAGHKPFLVLADYLTRHGIAVLRADDRGVAKSGGQFASATTTDFATDAEAGVAYLRTRHEIDGKKIGLIGHSEGGLIAPLVASRDRGIAFVVMMAGTGVRGDQVLVRQNVLVAESMGATRAQADAQGAQIRTLVDIVMRETDDAARAAKLREALAGTVPEAAIDTRVKTLLDPWFKQFLAHDPAPVLTKLTCPVLALNGQLDKQVPPDQNLPAIRAAFAASHNRHVDVEALPGLNHLSQTAKTGSPSEDTHTAETMPPHALQKTAAWILKQPAR